MRACLNVAQFKGVFEDDENVHIVMEWCKGGELTGAIAMAHYNEQKVRIPNPAASMLSPSSAQDATVGREQEDTFLAEC